MNSRPKSELNTLISPHFINYIHTFEEIVIFCYVLSQEFLFANLCHMLPCSAIYLKFNDFPKASVWIRLPQQLTKLIKKTWTEQIDRWNGFEELCQYSHPPKPSQYATTSGKTLSISQPALKQYEFITQISRYPPIITMFTTFSYYPLFLRPETEI